MRYASLALTGIVFCTLTPSAAAEPVSEPKPRCQLSDSDVDEVSGLSSDGKSLYAVNDGGRSLRVFVLDPSDCSVRDVRTAAPNPYDVEDLGIAENGDLWLADIGDNERSRKTVAMHVLSPDGGAKLYRLRYPDRPHDAEALLLDRSGTPHIVTKEVFGSALVYRPAAPLDENRPVTLKQVGAVSLPATPTVGGPFEGGLGSALITGAAVSHDGMVFALRTYTDAFVFSSADRQVTTALRKKPLIVPLPAEPQGEAIAWDPDGTLLSASEGVDQPIRAVQGVYAKATAHLPSLDQHNDPWTDRAVREESRWSTKSTGGTVLAAVVLVALALLVFRRRGRA